MSTFLISALVTLFVVIDPVGLGPIFIGLTAGLQPQVKRKIAVEACVITFFVLAGSALFGDWLLARLGISLAAFRIAGGLLLFAIAFEMVFERRVERKADHVAKSAHIAAFPLAIPLMAGPGAITATVLLAGRASGHILLIGVLLAVVVLVSLACLVVFRRRGRLGRLVGLTGNNRLARPPRRAAAALAVQYVVDGVRAV